MSETKAISVNGLSRGFVEGERRHQVLDGLDLHLNQGESVAIRGRSGSGKSTLLNILGGIDTPDAGSVVIAGQDLATMNERERTLFRRRHIGFVYQAFHLVPTLSVGDNIRLVLELNRAPRADARIGELLDAVGLADRRDSSPDLLSGGEQQRVAIARAIAHEPDLLIADEPTGNLDDATAETIIELLDRVVRQQRRSMVVATHSARVARTCTGELELRNGRLVADGG